MNTTIRVFGIFGKYWQPGLVKTRLASTIGNQAAADLQYAFLETLLCRFQTIPAARQLHFDPAERSSEFKRIAGPAWELVLQVKGDLGCRLEHFFAREFAGGASAVVAIGSDSPNLPIELVHEALDSLATTDVVLGPSMDGGYYLIGLARDLPGIFQRITWSSPQVWQQTVESLRSHQVPFVQLAPWYDVDDVDDLVRLWNDLRESRSAEFDDLFEAVRAVIEGECEWTIA